MIDLAKEPPSSRHRQRLHRNRKEMDDSAPLSSTAGCSSSPNQIHTWEFLVNIVDAMEVTATEDSSIRRILSTTRESSLFRARTHSSQRRETFDRATML